MSANSWIRFGLHIVFVCLYVTPSHYHHCANFIWRFCFYKMPFRYNLSGVWLKLSKSSQLSIIQYVGLCVFSLPISFVMIERIYILCLIIIIKSEVWTITHCLGLGHETMVCAVCLSIFLWHRMETYSALLVLCVGIHRSPVNSPHKGQWRGALMSSLICAWQNVWINYRDVGDRRRHRVCYDVTVMSALFSGNTWLKHCSC